MTDRAYNPLDKLNIARSIEVELLTRRPVPLSSVTGISGAGVYAIYYTGAYPAYAPIASKNVDDHFGQPIYIGKAIPKGGRKGGLTADASKGRALADRLGQHAASIEQVYDLNVDDFWVRHLIVDDIWIPLGENMLIETFKPVWNRVIDGFGNKDPGNRRKTQYKSPWDVLHPGRKVMEKLADSELSQHFLLQRLSDYFDGKPLAKLPKAIAKQIEDENLEAGEDIDQAEF
ncbi:MAG: Eco29kI family restriction endonuclease [Acidocella sp.]|nr:Eco29kI family restriction endonuclease [Acidocella sp.]